ncbi:MAG: toll/interleukin-1 receptor domain-containing protein, partial [Chloroflexota bacterium]
YLSSWGDALPGANLLIAFGYMDEGNATSPSGAVITIADLTLNAFSLLKRPVRTPRVFITYHRAHSTTLALLVAARLQLAGVEHPFMDLSDSPGDALHAEQRERLAESDYCVALLAPGSLDASYIQAELDWAFEAGVNIVPVWHDGFTPAHDYPPELTARSAIRITESHAEAYHAGLARLLNRLGYAPS